MNLTEKQLTLFLKIAKKEIVDINSGTQEHETCHELKAMDLINFEGSVQGIGYFKLTAKGHELFNDIKNKDANEYIETTKITNFIKNYQTIIALILGFILGLIFG
jgi:hypothetical protein